jgi:hypothetical protein
MDLRTQAILWAAIKQQNELRELAITVGDLVIADRANAELLRLADRLKDGISNTGHDN